MVYIDDWKSLVQALSIRVKMSLRKGKLDVRGICNSLGIVVMLIILL